MRKRVIIIASGETERRALPHLVRHLQERAINVNGIRIPPRNRALNAETAEKLIKAAWYENVNARPDKFVLVVDLDRSDPEETVEPIRTQLLKRVPDIEAVILFAYAQQHLEAWFFADAENLQRYLRQALGKVDTSRPDEIQNPKLHLKHLLADRLYTARVSEEIARTLDAGTIAGRSPSFLRFVEAVTNGPSSPQVN